VVALYLPAHVIDQRKTLYLLEDEQPHAHASAGGMGGDELLRELRPSGGAAGSRKDALAVHNGLVLKRPSAESAGDPGTTRPSKLPSGGSRLNPLLHILGKLGTATLTEAQVITRAALTKPWLAYGISTTSATVGKVAAGTFSFSSAESSFLLGSNDANQVSSVTLPKAFSIVVKDSLLTLNNLVKVAMLAAASPRIDTATSEGAASSSPAVSTTRGLAFALLHTIVEAEEQDHGLVTDADVAEVPHLFDAVGVICGVKKDSADLFMQVISIDRVGGLGMGWCFRLWEGEENQEAIA